MTIDNRLILENSKVLNVLYVEDDTILAQTTKVLLDNFFHSVDLAKDGALGYGKYLEYNKKNACYYDIVISDIDMPIMDGIEMSKSIKAINNEQVIIFITAFNEVKNLDAAVKLGINGFIPKPLEIELFKSTLYSVCQIVSDRKAVQLYYKQIEENEFINKDTGASLDLSTNVLSYLQENKECLSKEWTSKELVHTKLEAYSIDVEYFRTHYGLKIIEYFLNVIDRKEKLGNCPVLFIMLDFFKNKNLSLEDIFIICVVFKNTVISKIMKEYTYNEKIFNELVSILDKNFEGVISQYTKLMYIQKTKIKKLESSANIQKFFDVEITKEEDINCADYVLESDIYLLQDLEEDIDALAISFTTIHGSTVENCTDLGMRIQRYGKVLTNYSVFTELGNSISKLGLNFLENAISLVEDKEKIFNITALIEGFVNDLIVWRKEIFENNIEDPHFLDDSFFSNVDTIIMFIEYKEGEDATDDLDDLFF